MKFALPTDRRALPAMSGAGGAGQNEHAAGLPEEALKVRTSPGRG
jgi:hypothetical protein